eukprot:6491212-Amphidinium_carterae.4
MMCGQQQQSSLRVHEGPWGQHSEHIRSPMWKGLLAFDLGFHCEYIVTMGKNHGQQWVWTMRTLSLGQRQKQWGIQRHPFWLRAVT